MEEEDIVHQSVKNMTHNLSLSISKGRKFKQLVQLPRPANFYFTLSAFGQKSKSSLYETA